MARLRKRRIAFVVLVALVVGGYGFLYWLRGGDLKLGKPIPPECEFTRYDEISYIDDPGGPLDFRRLDIVAPLGRPRAPVVVILHGGGWTGGHRGQPAGQALAQWLAERGVIGVPMGYRLVPQVPPEEQPRDVAAGVAWLYRRVSLYAGDPSKIFLLGHSAGGHLASLVTSDKRYLAEYKLPSTVPAGVISIAGALDLRDPKGISSPSTRQVVLDVFGPDLQRRIALSPITFVRPRLPPFLLIRGKGDRVVPAQQVDDMSLALHAAGVPVKTLTVAGREHIAIFHAITQPGDPAAAAVLTFVNGAR
jgi:acetyl esterase/lipase